ncbi:MAG: hypothetical protein ACJAZO_003114, partial [Myxococcota bacterium]
KHSGTSHVCCCARALLFLPMPMDGPYRPSTANRSIQDPQPPTYSDVVIAPRSTSAHPHSCCSMCCDSRIDVGKRTPGCGRVVSDERTLMVVEAVMTCIHMTAPGQALRQAPIRCCLSRPRAFGSVGPPNRAPKRAGAFDALGVRCCQREEGRTNHPSKCSP